MKAFGQFLMGLIICLLCTTGCGLNMQNQARIEPFEPSEFFVHNQSARPLPPHTIPHERLVEQDGFYTGRTAGGELIATIPLSDTKELIEQGRTQFEIFCAPCHGQTGEGDGIIVERGFPPPPSFHTDALRQAPAGHYFEVITNGVGEMYSYAQRVPPEDRWAIIAYIRQLQSSQNAAPADVPVEDSRPESQDQINE